MYQTYSKNAQYKVECTTCVYISVHISDISVHTQLHITTTNRNMIIET